MNQKKAGRSATLLLAALTILAGLALPNGVGVPTGVSIAETAPAAMGQDPWAVWSHKQYDPQDVKPFTRELFHRNVAPIDNSWTSWDGYVAGLDPAPDLETQVLRFPTLDIDVLVSSAISPDDAERAKARRVAREMVVHQLKNGSGLLAEQFQGGEIAGVELDWHHADHMRPPSEMTLPVVGALFTATDFTEVLVAYIYAYNDAQLVARRQELELNQNQTLVETTTWAVPVLSAKTDVVFDSSDATVAGEVSARRWVIVNGENTSIAGTVTTGGGLELNCMPVIDGPIEQIDSLDIALPPMSFSMQEARSLAQMSGVYASGDLFLTTPPPDGTVIFAEGDVHVYGWGWERSLTIFAKLSVFFHGADSTLRAAESDILAVSYKGDVIWEMTNTSVEGLIASPIGDFIATGEACAFHGPITCAYLWLVQGGHTFTDGTAPLGASGSSSSSEQGAYEGGEQTNPQGGGEVAATTESTTTTTETTTTETTTTTPESTTTTSGDGGSKKKGKGPWWK